ncbi:hypothetical protein NDU88_002927 [Pleurodeles waltl]|uniref:Uncharacterized protein n=1 Tax=Pleurodeles waltl TaxID=8319 RepID=A0AAV7PAK2_PLEWA|nr:hypothetical protein NDU88_002927 [Pleurodeles waltl]
MALRCSMVSQLAKPLKRQLFFFEALQDSHLTTSTQEPQPMDLTIPTESPEQDATMERILKEITALGRRLEWMVSTISALAAETNSNHLDIASFQCRVSVLEHHITAVEDHLDTITERDQKLLFLRSKLIDLKNRSCRDNVSFFGFLEHIERSTIQAFT